jgi:hypothetical protein
LHYPATNKKKRREYKGAVGGTCESQITRKELGSEM